jgi:hypothetical protein
MPERGRIGFLSQATRSFSTMRTKKDQMIIRADVPLDPYADPVRYLKGLGIEAYLVEIKPADLPSAA